MVCIAYNPIVMLKIIGASLSEPHQGSSHLVRPTIRENLRAEHEMPPPCSS